MYNSNEMPEVIIENIGGIADSYSRLRTAHIGIKRGGKPSRWEDMNPFLVSQTRFFTDTALDNEKTYLGIREVCWENFFKWGLVDLNSIISIRCRSLSPFSIVNAGDIARKMEEGSSVYRGITREESYNLEQGLIQKKISNAEYQVKRFENLLGENPRKAISSHLLEEAKKRLENIDRIPSYPIGHERFRILTPIGEQVNLEIILNELLSGNHIMGSMPDELPKLKGPGAEGIKTPAVRVRLAPADEIFQQPDGTDLYQFCRSYILGGAGKKEEVAEKVLNLYAGHYRRAIDIIHQTLSPESALINQQIRFGGVI